jgi:hypothetical protein
MSASILVSASALVALGYAAAYALARFTLRGRSECVWELADLLFHAPYIPLLLGLVVSSLRELAPLGVDARWHAEEGATDATRAFLALYVVQSSAHVFVLALKRKVSSPAMYAAHHTLSIACYGHALWTGRLHFWAVLAALSEVTNVPLNTIFLMRALRLETTLALAYKVNGVLLWLTYVAFRLLLFPAWLLLFARDVREHHGATWARANGFERYAYASTTTVLLVLSCCWFSSITAGLLKAIRPPASAAASASAPAGGAKDD